MSWQVSWAGCRWRWNRPPPTCRPRAAASREYLGLFRQRRAELLGRGEPAGYDKRVTTTWALAFAELQPARPLGGGLLRLAACCAAEDIPLHLLLRPRPGLADAFRRGGGAAAGAAAGGCPGP